MVKKTKRIYRKNKKAVPMRRKNIYGAYYSKIPKKVYSQTFNVCLSANTLLTNKYEKEWQNAGIDDQKYVPPTSWGIDFRLKDAINANEFYGLMFNRYKINAIELTLTPKGCLQLNNSMSSSFAPPAPNQSQGYSYIYLFTDPNDSVKPVGQTAEEMEDYFKRQKNVIKRRCDKKVRVKFKPTILNVVYQKPRTDGQDQGIDFAYSSIKSPWIEINELPSPSETVIPSLDFAHFGLKGMITSSNPNGRWKYKIDLKYYVSFNGLRR